MLRRGRCFALSYWASTPIGTSISATVPRFFFLYKLTVGRVKLKLLKMKKVMLTAFAVGLCIAANVMAQVPSYVPTNGLVGYWPFNGNANDESGNGNNGTVNGATLTTDRFGNANKAYSFDGVNDFIQCQQSGLNANISRTVSFWIKSSSTTPGSIFSYGTVDNNPGQDFRTILNSTCNGLAVTITGSGKDITYSSNNQWDFFVVTFDNSNGNNVNAINVYKNQLLQTNYCNNSGNSTINTSNNLPITIGRYHWLQYTGNSQFFNGNIDDIGFWNRALTQQEITALYNSCTGNEITSQPTNAVNSIGSNAQFSVNAVAGSTYQWQSNPLNTGWLNLTNNSTYSGATTNTLTVSNTTISNHHQPFRAIVNAGGCVDTSNVAQIIIGDTCLTTVTDTLIINTTLGLPAPNNENTILIYPNPASDHITIDNGNYTAMAGYTIKIENNAGQQVFQSLINQAQFYVDLSTWSGNGLYFVHLIDAQGNTVTVRKIVWQ